MRFSTDMTFKMALAVMVLVGAVFVAGCNNSGDEADSGKSSTAGAGSTDDAGTTNNGTEDSGTTPIQPSEPAKPIMPTVKLTEALAKTCLVKVGDTMPEGTFVKLDGQAVSLRDLLVGKKLMVVCFWKANHPYSLEELKELDTYIVGPYASKGVQVVAINEDDPVNIASKVFQEYGGNYPCLLDPKGAYFAKIATQELPRTYLLDANGKVLWFDMGYFLSTRRDLEQGIQFTLEAK